MTNERTQTKKLSLIINISTERFRDNTIYGFNHTQHTTNFNGQHSNDIDKHHNILPKIQLKPNQIKLRFFCVCQKLN